jgi:hypothetical protein
VPGSLPLKQSSLLNRDFLFRFGEAKVHVSQTGSLAAARRSLKEAKL